MLPDRSERRIGCRDCGIDITEHVRYNRGWTQCSHCYWKSRLGRQKPLEELRRRHAEIRAQLKALPAEIEQTRAAIKHRTADLAAKTPWWRKLLGELLGTSDQVLSGHWQRLHALEVDLRHLEHEHSQIGHRIQERNKVKKRFLEAQVARTAAEAKKRLKAQEHERFCADALANLGREFERTQFYIQNRDYKRGNAIDNYFRKALPDVVIAAFEHRCVFCNARDDLTFDHYGLAKNEGGNFVLILADKASIRLNIVVLCRGCNAMKGERSYSTYFSVAQQAQVTACQKTLFESLLRDQEFLDRIKRWCS